MSSLPSQESESAIGGQQLKKRRGILRRFGSVFILLFMVAVLSIASPYFLTIGNVMNIIRQSAINGTLAVGMTFVIIAAGIDLSVGSILAFVGCLIASLTLKGMPSYLGLTIGLCASLGFGLLNGVIVTSASIPPFIVTLGLMYAIRGAVLLMTNGTPISGLPQIFQKVGSAELGFIPAIAIIWLFVAFLGYMILNHMKIGRHIYAVGGNREAARFSGVNINRVITFTFIVSGLTSGIAGFIMMSRLDSAQPVAGMGYELLAIAAVIIGGTSFFGGEGSLGGTLIGTLVIGVLQNGMNLLNIGTYMQQVVTGLVIVGVVFLDVLRRKGR